MVYVLMLLADPGTDRERLQRVFADAPDIESFQGQTNRFHLAVGNAVAELQIGSKDPVGSVHVEFEAGNSPQMVAIARRALELAGSLDMRMEDVVWGHEVTAANMDQLNAYWQQKTWEVAVSPAAAKPWWRFW
jgi:hypothetical protein